jgi:hypothetical protein
MEVQRPGLIPAEADLCLHIGTAEQAAEKLNFEMPCIRA